MICSIVRTVAPGTICSHPAGRVEVFFLAPYRPCEHTYETSHDVRLVMRGRTAEETIAQAEDLARTFQNCCNVAGITYSVEQYDTDDDPRRAPLK